MKKPKTTVSYEVDEDGKIISKTTTTQYDTSVYFKEMALFAILIVSIILAVVAATVKLIILM